MARTDKDRPYWVRADDPLETGRYVTHYHVSYRGELLECDLDVSAKHKRSRYTNCGYWLPYTMYVPGPPARFRRAHWHGPERVRERVQLGAAAKLARGGDVEHLDFANFQHRHGARRDWF